MSQVFAGGIALIIAFILWSSKKQSNGLPFFKTQKVPFSNSNGNNSFVQKKKIIKQKINEKIKNRNMKNK